MITNEEYSLDLTQDTTVGILNFSNNKGVKYLPKSISGKLSSLGEVLAHNCSLSIIRDFYFRSMQEVLTLDLSYNMISTIEPGAFVDLINVGTLKLDGNRLETLDGQLFSALIKLAFIRLHRNRIKFLSPTTFKIPDGRLFQISLSSNVCIDKNYGFQQFKDLDTDLVSNCSSDHVPHRLQDLIPTLNSLE